MNIVGFDEVISHLEPPVSVVVRCHKCARLYPDDPPPLMARVGLSRGDWIIQRAERRTKRSHALAKKPLGTYMDTPSGNRFIWVVDNWPTATIGKIQCRRCKRRLPYGKKKLIAQAKFAIEEGRADFLG